MKIKKLILENINSLYGRWTLDFEDPVFDSGIFAISGPTGSGKTSILDAISLALYTETPRIRRGSDIAEVISKGAPGCRAELIFEVDGQIYEAVFGFATYQRGPRRGQVNESRKFHLLSSNGKPISERLSETKEKIVEITGMNSEQFRRAVLLAQGQFDAFLLAGENKAETLEQITGTEVYSAIAARIHEKSSRLADRIRNEEEILSGAKLLAPEEEAAKQEALGQLNRDHVSVLAEQKQLDGLRRTFEKIAADEQSLLQNDAAAASLAEERIRFAPEEKRLAAAQKAAAVRPFEQTCAKLTAEQRSDSETRAKLQLALPKLKEDLARIRTEAERAKQNRDRLQESMDRLNRLAREVGSLDRDAAALQQELDTLGQQKKSADGTRADTLTAIGETKQTLDTLQKDKQVSERYLADHPSDQHLPELRARWSEQLKTLRNREQDRSAREKEYRRSAEEETLAAAAVQDRKDALALAEQTLLDAAAKESAAQTALRTLLGGNTREALEEKLEILIRNQNALRRILSYEEARKELADGEECPLCGSRNHPFALGNIPAISQNEADLAALRKQLKSVAAAEKELQLCHDRKLTADQSRSACAKDLEMAQNLLARKKQEREKLTQTLEDLRNAAEQQKKALAQEFADSGLTWDGRAALPLEIAFRMQQWQLAKSKLENFSARGAVLENELKNHGAQLEKTDAELRTLTQRITEAGSQLAAVRTERFAKFGDKDPAKETQSAQLQWNTAQEEYNCQTAARSSVETTLRSQEQDLESLNRREAGRAGLLAEAETKFLSACAEAGMTPESFRAALLGESELAALSAERARLQEQERSLAARKKELLEELDSLRKSVPESSTREKTAARLAELQTVLAENRKQAGALGSELDRNGKLRAELKERADQLDQLRKTGALWAELDSMIGGTGGQRFCRIAQGITLDCLLVNANAVLSRMNSRYELIRSADKKNMLDIDVIDHFQGDTIRPCDNLSGGERFQVSMALALGLSSMAGEKIRVDSLFLDEGFGSLDPDSLEMALNTLSSLRRQEGKIIGIISHIQNIGENIPALIEVVPESGGRSRLVGAGVSGG